MSLVQNGALWSCCYYKTLLGKSMLEVELIGRQGHRRNFVCDNGDLSPPLLKVVVTVTATFSKWNLQFFKEF